MPLNLFTSGWGNVIRPYGAKLREQNQLKKLFKNLILSSLAFMVLVSIITTVLYIFSNWFLETVFTSDYKSVFEYLFFWAILSAVVFLRANASYGLQVIIKFKSLALYNVATMVITITLALILTNNIGIKGALLASISGEVLFALILWLNLYKSIFRQKTGI